MKTYDEITMGLLKRRDRHNMDRQRKRKVIVQTAGALLCMSLILLLGIHVLQGPFAHSGQFPDAGTSAPGGAEQLGTNPMVPGETGDHEAILRPHLPIVWGDTDGELVDAAFVELDGKYVTVDLYDALMDPENFEKYIAISVHFALDDQFAYNGKTLADYDRICDENKLLIEKLSLLFKTGDLLRYGDDLYLNGTPTGERWSREMYYETIAYLGDEWLKQYIVDGCFLREKVVQDLDQCGKDGHDNDAAYKEACDAYFQYRIQDTMEWLKEQGVDVEARGENLLIAFVTKEEWTSISFDHILLFGLAAKVGEPMDMVTPSVAQ